MALRIMDFHYDEITWPSSGSGRWIVIQCITIKWQGARDCHICVIPRTNTLQYYIWSRHWRSNRDLMVTSAFHLIMWRIVVMHDRPGSRVVNMTGGLTYHEATNDESVHTKSSLSRNIIYIIAYILLITIMHVT